MKMGTKINHFVHKILGENGFIIRKMDPRPMISYIKRNLESKKGLVGIEIGTWKGKNAESILKNLPIKKLYIVDPYMPYNKNDNDIEKIYRICIKRLAKYRKKIVFIRKTSEDAMKYIPEKVDFIYIDADHSYKFVKQDIGLYLSLVKGGGVIGGHDIEIRDVSKAVFEEFSPSEVNISVPDWWVKK